MRNMQDGTRVLDERGTVRYVLAKGSWCRLITGDHGGKELEPVENQRDVWREAREVQRAQV